MAKPLEKIRAIVSGVANTRKKGANYPIEIWAWQKWSQGWGKA